uniref:Uncharacterized protein n=1 Tax=Rhizophora mucronata TaxID=61149 RepID=A0A2P2P418_RHIMU
MKLVGKFHKASNLLIYPCHMSNIFLPTSYLKYQIIHQAMACNQNSPLTQPIISRPKCHNVAM